MSRRYLWLYRSLSLLGLALGLWGFAGLSRLGALPADFAVPTRWPVVVDGVRAGSPEELGFLVESRPPGWDLAITQAGGETAAVRVAPQYSRSHLALTLLDGLLFLAVNLLVFASRHERPPARPFFWLTWTAGVSILIGGLYFPRPGMGPDQLLALTWIACLTFLPVFFVQMSLEFPSRRSILEARPRLVPALLAAAALLTVWQGAAYLRYFAAPGPEAWRAARLPRLIAQALLVGGTAAGFALLLASGRRLELERARRQLKWLLWGFAVGVAPYVFLRTLPQLAGLRPPFGPAFDRVCEMTVPLTFTLAIVWWKFLDIDIIIRRSLLYTLLAGALAGAYLIVAVLLGSRLRARVPASAPYVPIAAALAAAALFAPTRRALGLWIDRTFFRIGHAHAAAVRDLKESLAGAADPRAVGDRLLGQVTAALGSARAAVVGADGEALAGDPTLAAAAAPALPAPGPGRLLAAPDSTSQPELECADYPAALRAAGAPLAVPLRAEGDVRGWLLVGEKRSERRFIEQDITLVTEAGAAAGSALGRIALVRRAAEEEARRRRLDEIDRLKSDFLSRVAHDLRTPLTSISWSADNLLDGLAGPLDARQLEYLRSMKAATGQLGRLVGNLLEISRLEVGKPRLAVGPVDLAAVVDEAALALSPLARERGVAIRITAPSAPPSARGDREKLAEVVANLLENALRYSPGGAAVEIALAGAAAGAAGGAVTLAVRDHGPGLADGEAAFVFDRFRQGRPSPYVAQSGFGLGLYVVKSYVELMGGAVTVRNHPEGGAEFTCALPACPQPQGDPA